MAEYGSWQHCYIRVHFSPAFRSELDKPDLVFQSFFLYTVQFNFCIHVRTLPMLCPMSVGASISSRMYITVSSKIQLLYLQEKSCRRIITKASVHLYSTFHPKKIWKNFTKDWKLTNNFLHCLKFEPPTGQRLTTILQCIAMLYNGSGHRSKGLLQLGPESRFLISYPSHQSDPHEEGEEASRRTAMFWGGLRWSRTSDLYIIWNVALPGTPRAPETPCFWGCVFDDHATY